MTEPEPLEPSDSPSAVLEGNLRTVTDDEYFDAQTAIPPGVDDEGREYDPMAGVVDDRPR